MTDWLIDERMNQPTYQSTNLPINQPANEYHEAGREFPQLVKKFSTIM